MQWLLGARSGSGVCFCAWEGRGGTWRMPFQSFSSFPLYIHPSTASETIFPVLLPDRSRLLFHTCGFSHPSVPLLLVAFIVIVVLSLGSPLPSTSELSSSWRQRRLRLPGSESPPPVLPFRPFKVLLARVSLVPSISVPLQASDRVISRQSSRAFPSICEKRK